MASNEGVHMCNYLDPELAEVWARVQIRDPGRPPLTPLNLIDERVSHVRQLLETSGAGPGYYKHVAQDLDRLYRLRLAFSQD
jgi:hypothetical protein